MNTKPYQTKFSNQTSTAGVKLPAAVVEQTRQQNSRDYSTLAMRRCLKKLLFFPAAEVIPDDQIANGSTKERRKCENMAMAIRLTAKAKIFFLCFLPSFHPPNLFRTHFFLRW